MVKLDYLQLEIPHHFQRQTINNLQNIKIYCNYSQSSYSHEVHRENSQLNLITDLLINMSRQHNLVSNTIFSQINTILHDKQKQKSGSSESQNLSYLVRMIDEIYTIVKTKNDIHIHFQELKIHLANTLINVEKQIQQITVDIHKLNELLNKIKEIILS